MTKQERLYNMFALSVLRKVVELQNDKTLSAEDLDNRITEYVVDNALNLNLLTVDGWTGFFSLNDETKEEALESFKSVAEVHAESTGG
jgi:hypothetical protein